MLARSALRHLLAAQGWSAGCMHHLEASTGAAGCQDQTRSFSSQPAHLPAAAQQPTLRIRPISQPATHVHQAGLPQTAQVLDGKSVAAQWLAELAVEVAEVSALIHRPPGLAVVVVGARPDSLLYVTRKQEACQKAGVHVAVHHLPAEVSQEQLEGAVQRLCADGRVDGVLIQLPLPGHLCEEAVMEHIDPRKDVDGFHPLNMGRMLMRGRVARLVPCTPLGCMELLERSGVQVRGRSAVVMGDSNIVGTPLAAMLRDKGAAAVTVCHQLSYREWFEADDRLQLERVAADACLPRLPGPSSTGITTTTSSASSTNHQSGVARATGVACGSATGVSGAPSGTRHACGFEPYHLPSVTRGADILVVAVGVPLLVRRDWVKPGAVVIDVGINVVPQPPPCAAAGCRGEDGGRYHARQQQQQQGDQQGSHQHSGSSAQHGTGDQQRGLGEGSSAGQQGTGQQASTNLTGPNAFAPGSYHVVGDVHFEEVSQVASAITPVPGGIGPMTIAAVLANTLRAARYHTGLLHW